MVGERLMAWGPALLRASCSAAPLGRSPRRRNESLRCTAEKGAVQVVAQFWCVKMPRSPPLTRAMPCGGMRGNCVLNCGLTVHQRGASVSVGVSWGGGAAFSRATCGVVPRHTCCKHGRHTELGHVVGATSAQVRPLDPPHPVCKCASTRNTLGNFPPGRVRKDNRLRCAPAAYAPPVITLTTRFLCFPVELPRAHTM